MRTWLPFVIVAALVGGAIGAGVTALSRDNNNGSGGSSVTIHESSAAPGAAVLSGNVTIPKLVARPFPRWCPSTCAEGARTRVRA